MSTETLSIFFDQDWNVPRVNTSDTISIAASIPSFVVAAYVRPSNLGTFEIQDNFEIQMKSADGDVSTGWRPVARSLKWMLWPTP